MSVNIYDGTNLTPIAGKTVPMPYTPAPQSMIGDAWVSGHAYAVGDYCIDGNVLYRCKTAHTSSASNRPPYASYWDAVSVTSQLGGTGKWKLYRTLTNSTKVSYPDEWEELLFIDTGWVATIGEVSCTVVYPKVHYDLQCSQISTDDMGYIHLSIFYPRLSVNYSDVYGALSAINILKSGFRHSGTTIKTGNTQSSNTFSPVYVYYR